MVSLKVKEVFCLVYSGLLFISGLLLIAFSAYLLVKLFYPYYTFIPSKSVGPFFVIFLLGVAHLSLTWLGIKGPTREHNFHIVLFMVFSLVLLGIEFLVGVWSIVLWDESDVGTIDLMVKSFDELIKLNSDKNQWNKLQSQFHCCGVNNQTDYLQSDKTDSILTSCFLKQENVNNTIGIPIVFHEGCKKPLIKYVKRILIDGAVMGFVCAAFHAFGIYTFFTYFRTLRDERAERVARRIAMQRELAEAGNHEQRSSITSNFIAPPQNSSGNGSRDGPLQKSKEDKKKAKRQSYKENSAPTPMELPATDTSPT